jgi:rhamnopyranosyl-N-acetylglucosaminyl-diphospho-decaprenol beta-1,3/1,4-galactofuranosyltransferase
MMDDDGYPSQECLERLLLFVSQYDYVTPVCINIDNHNELSWFTRMKNFKRTNCYRKLKESWGDIMNYVTPFNGVLLSKQCVAKVGYVNKYLFLWGDEYEHYYRCKKNGFVPVTIMNALFFHPAQKLPLVPVVRGLFAVPYVDSKLRMICLIRNGIYISLHYRNKLRILLHLLAYSWLFLITRKLDIEGYKLYLASVMDAFKNDFTRHLKYL